MFKFFGSLFGSEKAIDNISSGIDKAIFTDEEKSDYLLMFLKAYHPFRKAQRFLALLVGIPYMFFIVVAGLVFCVGFILPPELITETNELSIITNEYYKPSAYGQYLMDGSAKLVTMINNALGGAMQMVFGFYFAGGMLEGAINAFSKKNK